MLQKGYQAALPAMSPTKDRITDSHSSSTVPQQRAQLYNAVFEMRGAVHLKPEPASAAGAHWPRISSRSRLPAHKVCQYSLRDAWSWTPCSVAGGAAAAGALG